jgi:hypothetical protein
MTFKEFIHSELFYKILYWTTFTIMCFSLLFAGYERGRYSTAVDTHKKCNQWILDNIYHGNYDTIMGVPYVDTGFLNFTYETNASVAE